MSTNCRRLRRHRRASQTAALMSSLYNTDKAQFYIELNKRMVSWLDEIRHRAELLRDTGSHLNSGLSVFAVLENAEYALRSVRKMDQTEINEAINQLTAESIKVLAKVLGPEFYRLIGRYHPKYLL